MIPRVVILLAVFATVVTHAQGQTNEFVTLLNDFEAKAAVGTPRAIEKDSDCFERLQKANQSKVLEAMPAITHATTSLYVSVRRLAAMDFFSISLRPDGRALLKQEVVSMIPLLIDEDVPTRRVDILALNNAGLDALSPAIPALRAFLAREDAVSTVGSAVFWILLEASPGGDESTRALVAYMERKDQTSTTRDELLGGVGHVVAQNNVAGHAVSENAKIASAVMTFANDPSERVSVEALQTMRQMSERVRADNQQSLAEVAADARRPQAVRDAASRAISGQESPTLPTE